VRSKTVADLDEGVLVAPIEETATMGLVAVWRSCF
jgi:hypothetical protein